VSLKLLKSQAIQLFILKVFKAASNAAKNRRNQVINHFSAGIKGSPEWITS
jgi:hypothetical protein